MQKKWRSSVKNNNLSKIILVSILGTIATILMLIDFPLFFSPSFMKMDISELPALFISFYFGPLEGASVIIIKVFLKMLFKPTQTSYIGELVNIIAGISYCIPAGIIYKLIHTKKGAIISLIVTTLITSILLVFVNSYITFPMYGKIYGMSAEKIVMIASKINPLVKNNISLMLFSIFPFNLIKYSIISIITFLLYNRLNLFIKEHIK